MVLILYKYLLSRSKNFDGFRPLAGIMVLIDAGNRTLTTEYDMFPSPCGDYGSYHSRPSNRFVFNTIRFRPLAGIMVLIKGANNMTDEEKKIKFPSPCGDYGSYHNSDLYRGMIIPTCFRPLTGIMVLIFLHFRMLRDDTTVSVPLRGLWFLSFNSREVILWKTRKSFRPLTGIMVLI